MVDKKVLDLISYAYSYLDIIDYVDMAMLHYKGDIRGLEKEKVVK